MTCDHADPCKEARFSDPASPPFGYFLPRFARQEAKKTNEYDLCHFYQVGLPGDLPNFPSPREPAICDLLSKFLLKARVLWHPHLVVAFLWDSTTAICLLQELHIKDSLRHPQMEPKVDVGGKAIRKLSFCPFCLYSRSNDMSYMNHIMCGHYHANYGCWQCLHEVFTTGQQLKNLLCN